MRGKTFVEKIFNAEKGSIVFQKPDIILTHDNTASIFNTFQKMGGERVKNPDQLMIVLDHNAPPTSAALANQYQKIRDIVAGQGISNFHDAGKGICHQIMADYAKPGMVIVGSDSHTCTAGAFNAFAAGIDRTESAGLWQQGETWFRVPESLKITLRGKLPKGVYAKDISLWIIGMIGSSGADYMSIEYHGDGLKSLTIDQRMTLANLASEMGAKNAVFPNDEVLEAWLGEKTEGVWADENAAYDREIEMNLSALFPLVAAPHHVDNVKAVAEVRGTKLHEALVGTCTNGRFEDLQIVAEILKGKTIPAGFQMVIVPASKKVYLKALREGIIEILLDAGANVLSASCGPCLGTGQGIPADGWNVISTSNRNFKGRMGNKESSIYLASPATVAHSALAGEIVDPRGVEGQEKFPYSVEQSSTVTIPENENRRLEGVWNYTDVNDLNTDQMFAGNLTYKVLSSDAESIMPYLFEGFDVNFTKRVEKEDIILAGANFGCGSSREHPAVGLAHAGVKAVICKSVNRIFYRSSVNQGLPIILLPEAVDAYNPGDEVKIDFEKGIVSVGSIEFSFAPLPQKLMGIFEAKGLVSFIKGNT
ncbi:MAG: 3-isopropylmalate dehydratase large subunit [Bacteroidales bacterium]|nr:3-isopropylmalate dehydratase large subunit [Bacteroidales bacterium]MCF6341850.1 3-isopropylmalate dehydratase large subunit [Bacteroidales bacterium]